MFVTPASALTDPERAAILATEPGLLPLPHGMEEPEPVEQAGNRPPRQPRRDAHYVPLPNASWNGLKSV